MMVTLETNRLLLCPLELADAEQAQPLFAQWEVVKYLNSRVPWPFPADGAYRYYHDVALPAIERGDEWHWTIRRKAEPGRMIGSISLIKGEETNRGFWLGLPWQRQGYMPEACDAVTDYWFRQLGFTVMRVAKAILNEASRKISLRQGMRVVDQGERDYVSGRLESEVWEITAADWMARGLR